MRVWERRWAGQPDLEMSQKDVSAPAERVKTIVPFCLSRLCLSAWRGLILARACSRWFIKMGPGKTRGPGEKETFTCMHNAHKWERTCGNTTQKNTQEKEKKKLRHKQGSNNQGTAPRLSQHLKVISAWEKKWNGHKIFSHLWSCLIIQAGVIPPVCIIHFFKIHKTESIQPDNISSVNLIHTSAFFKPVPTINPLTFLFLADLNVLLNVHSWRGRDRHSWKHIRPQIQAGQRKKEKRGWSRAEQKKQNNTNITEWTDNGGTMNLHSIEIKDKQQQQCKMLWYENARVSYFEHKQHGRIALQIPRLTQKELYIKHCD